MKYTDNSITVTRDLSKPLKGVDEDCGDIPDVAMTLAVVGMFAEGRTSITSRSNLNILNLNVFFHL